MSDVRDPDRDQVAPVPNDNPSCHDLVIEDLKERKEFGFNKYQSLLQPGNGRNMMLDFYEELQDALCYAKGVLVEQDMFIRVRKIPCSMTLGHGEHFYETEVQWAFCEGHEKDHEPLGEDITGHTVTMGVHHPDGRSCSYHQRLSTYCFQRDGVWYACLREHA